MKYQKVQDAWVYAFITPNNKFYFGQSCQNKCHDRWKMYNYIDGSMRPYIMKYGWDNIEKKVLVDGLTPEQAVVLEGLLITAAKEAGVAINHNDSGFATMDMKEYEARRRQKPERKEYLKRYAEEHREELNEYRNQWHREHKDQINARRRAKYAENKKLK